LIFVYLIFIIIIVSSGARNLEAFITCHFQHHLLNIQELH
jgi:hypothetical protein